MTSNNCWLPELIFCDDFSRWTEYQNLIYSIFKNDFITSKPYYKGHRVLPRKEPYENGVEESFFHITCNDYFKNNNRSPDLRRCERIKWVRSFIENYNCDLAACRNCDGVKIWEEPYKMYSRIHLLLEEERYLVVIEKRKTYYLLVTAFYFENNHSFYKYNNT